MRTTNDRPAGDIGHAESLSPREVLVFDYLTATGDSGPSDGTWAENEDDGPNLEDRLDHVADAAARQVMVREYGPSKRGTGEVHAGGLARG